MKRSKEQKEEDQSLRELILGAAKEAGEFSLADLADDLIKQGLYDDASRMTRMQFPRFRRGVIDEVRSAVKSEKMNDGDQVYQALEEGPKARWKRWSLMDRYESREACLLLDKKSAQARKEYQHLRRKHIERFDEDPEDFRAKTEERKTKRKKDLE